MNNKQGDTLKKYFAIRGQLLAITVLLLWTLAATLPAGAQAVYGSVFGTVTDQSGAVVPNVTITVTDIAKGTTVTAATNDSGLYRVQHLIPDAYKIEAGATGYSKSVADNVLVYADTSPEVNLLLTVGAVSNSVTVSAGEALLETDRAEVSTILDAAGRRKPAQL